MPKLFLVAIGLAVASSAGAQGIYQPIYTPPPPIYVPNYQPYQTSTDWRSQNPYQRDDTADQLRQMQHIIGQGYQGRTTFGQ